VPRTGTLVLGWERPLERALAERSWAPVESFGLEGEGAGGPDVGSGGPRAGGPGVGAGGPRAGAHPRWRAVDITYGPATTAFTVEHDARELGRVETPLAGAYNVRNCLAALAAAHAVGAEWATLVEGLRSFRSVRRRLEVRDEPGGVTVIDDFAHHPTAVRETLAAVRQRYAGRRLIAVFEPRSYTSQTRAHQEDFRAAFRMADRVILAALFRPERYDENSGMSPAQLVEGLRCDGINADYIPAVDDIVAELSSSAEPGDVVILMSNGGFGGIHEKLLEALRRRG